MEISSQLHAPANLPPGKDPQCPQNGRLGGPQSWFEHFGEEKIVVPLSGI